MICLCVGCGWPKIGQCGVLCEERIALAMSSDEHLSAEMLMMYIIRLEYAFFYRIYKPSEENHCKIRQKLTKDFLIS